MTHPVARTSDRIDVASLAQQLLRIDTSNPGGAEKPAAELVADVLSDLGAPLTGSSPNPVAVAS